MNTQKKQQPRKIKLIDVLNRGVGDESIQWKENRYEVISFEYLLIDFLYLSSLNIFFFKYIYLYIGLYVPNTLFKH